MRLISMMILGLGLAAPAVFADSYFTCTEGFEAGKPLELGTVVADGDGMIELYDYRLGEKGDKLAEIAVTKGANSPRVNTGNGFQHNVLAEMVIGGEVVASHVYKPCAEE